MPSSSTPALRRTSRRPPVRVHLSVRLLVSSRRTGSVAHGCFSDLPQFLAAGDLLVVNTSATLPAAVPARRADGTHLELRLSTPAPGRDPGTHWIVELRHGDHPFGAVTAGDELALPGGATARIVAAYAAPRLWLARLDLQQAVATYLAEHGHPIRYRHVPQRWPLSAYQTVYAAEPGSAEMPSAGRPFTAQLITRLVTSGVLVAPITLHRASPRRNATNLHTPNASAFRGTRRIW